MEAMLDSIRPILTKLSKIGIFPFTLQLNGILELSTNKVLYSISILALKIVFIYLRIIHIYEYKLEGSFVSKLTFIFASIATIIFISITIVVNIAFKKFVEDFLRTFWEFDCKVKDINVLIGIKHVWHIYKIGFHRISYRFD